MRPRRAARRCGSAATRSRGRTTSCVHSSRWSVRVRARARVRARVRVRVRVGVRVRVIPRGRVIPNPNPNQVRDVCFFLGTNVESEVRRPNPNPNPSPNPNPAPEPTLPVRLAFLSSTYAISAALLEGANRWLVGHERQVGRRTLP